jgi:hypothetical protein
MFEWTEFVQEHNIDYVVSGPSTAKGNIYIECPFCARGRGSSKLMGLSMHGTEWGCWRDSTHRGRRPARLIRALIGCSMEEAIRISGEKAFSPGPQDFSFGDHIASLLASKPVAQAVKAPLEFPPALKPLVPNKVGSHIFFDYLVLERGYNKAEAFELAQRYGLRFAINGPFRYRIIFPVRSLDGDLVCWSGRSIVPNTRLRYKTLSCDQEKARHEGLPEARTSIEQCLWQADRLVDTWGETLVLCEGPFDAMKIDFYLAKRGVRATCLFAKNISAYQVGLLVALVDGFKRRVLVLDRDSEFEAVSKVSPLTALGFEFRFLPAGAKDPDSMTMIQLERWLL